MPPENSSVDDVLSHALGSQRAGKRDGEQYKLWGPNRPWCVSFQTMSNHIAAGGLQLVSRHITRIIKSHRMHLTTIWSLNVSEYY